MTAPTANILRAGDVIVWLAISRTKFAEIARTGAIGGAPLVPGGRRFYLRTVVAHVLLGAPFPSSPFGDEPQPELLRRADVLAWTGLHEKQFRHLEASGLSLGTSLKPNGKRHYAKHRIRAALFTPLLPLGWGVTKPTPIPLP